MDSEKFWDRNPEKFRILFIVFSSVLLFIISFNTYRDATTTLSGTQYFLLPSHYYITKELKLNTIPASNDGVSDVETIPVGSFLLSVNRVPMDSIPDIGAGFKNMAGDSILLLRVFNLKKVVFIKDGDNSKNINSLIDTFRVKKSALGEQYFRFLQSGNFLGWIMEGGATDRAGIKAGDVLISVNDTELKLREGSGDFTVESLKFLRTLPREVPAYFKVLRNNQERIFDVRLLTFGFQLITFLLIVCGLLLFFTGVYFGLARPNLPAARIVAYLFIAVGFQLSLANSYYPPEYDFFSFFRTYINNAAGFFQITLILHSLFYFPVKMEGILKRKFNVHALYIFSFVQLIIFSIWFIIDYRSINSTIFEFFVIAYVIYYIMLTRMNSNYIQRKDVKLFRFANLFWLFLFLIFFLPSIINLAVKIKYPDWYQYNFLCVLLLPCVYLYLTWHYRLLDITIRIRRSIQYNLITGLWKTILLAGFMMVLYVIMKSGIRFPEFRLTGTSIEWSTAKEYISNPFIIDKVFIAACTLILALILFKLGRKGQNYLDKKFYRQEFDYKTAQTDLIKVFQTKLSVESLAPIISERISELVRIKRAGVVLFNENESIWNNKIYCYDNRNLLAFEISAPEGIAKTVKYIHTISDVKQCPGEIKNYLLENNFFNIVPIKTNEKYLGALFVGEKLSETSLRNEDVEFLLSVVASSSVAVENAFLYEELANGVRIKRELEIAHNIQVASLPQSVPVVPGLDIYATSIPATEVGGDFYDFLNGAADGITIVMGDVSGKGTSAALYMSKVQGIFQTLHEFNLSPVNLMMRANHLLYKHIDSKSYITAVGAGFNTKNKTLSFARAGHLPLYHYKSKPGEITKIQPNGMGLGLSSKNIFDISIEEIKINYSEGDIFLFVSDGVLDALNRIGEQFGEIKLLELIKRNSGSDSRKIINEILDSLIYFTSDTSQFDDITLVAVKSI